VKEINPGKGSRFDDVCVRPSLNDGAFLDAVQNQFGSHTVSPPRLALTSYLPAIWMKLMSPQKPSPISRQRLLHSRSVRIHLAEENHPVSRRVWCAESRNHTNPGTI